MITALDEIPARLADNLDNLRQVNADALAYMGYGMLAAKGLLREALDELQWDPPRIMSTAFMWYLMGFDKFEGWVGIDQFDPRNPLTQRFHERFVARYGGDPPMWPNAIPVLAYDTARVLVEELHAAGVQVVVLDPVVEPAGDLQLAPGDQRNQQPGRLVFYVPACTNSTRRMQRLV